MSKNYLTYNHENFMNKEGNDVIVALNLDIGKFIKAVERTETNDELIFYYNKFHEYKTDLQKQLIPLIVDLKASLYVDNKMLFNSWETVQLMINGTMETIEKLFEYTYNKLEF